MRSLIGEKGCYTEKGNPYITWCFGLKKEGEQPPAQFSSPDLAWNCWMDSFLQEVEKNKSKDIIWRLFPELHIIVDTDNNSWYYIFARFTFE